VPRARHLGRVLLATTVLTAVVAFFLLATLPPRAADVSTDGVDPAILQRTIAGAYHVHTTRSDGAGSKGDVAAAAARAGLQFVILTDHGDGTREPDPPEYVDGVLMLDAVEISSNGGHYVALGMPAAPYPLGGEASAVVEDVARLGGFGIAAHPHHPKPELAWSDWSLPINGLEWINADAEWRNESGPRLARVLFDYLLRPAPAIVSVFDRPVATLDRWSALLQERAVAALAAADAHGGVSGAAMQEGGGRFAAGPSYEASFRALSNRVLLAEPPSGDAQADGRALLDAIRCGRLYTVVDGIARGAVLAPGGPGEPLRMASPLPQGARVEEKGVMLGPRWIEVYHPLAPGDPPVPWILANPDLTGCPVPSRPDPVALDREPLGLSSEWRAEKDPHSLAEVTAHDGTITLRFRLREGERASQFAGAVADLRQERPIEALAFSARASRPMRVSVQLRFPPDDLRWTTSVYVDETEREIVVPVDRLVPAERTAGPRPDAARARSILFVVDLTNARPGDSGELTISGLGASARSPAAPR